MYTIDLVTILQLLGEFRKNGILRTEAPSGLPGLKQPCLIVVELRNGEMITCSVRDMKEHTLLNGMKAFQAILAAGQFTWIFEDAALQEMDSQQAPSNPLPISLHPDNSLRAEISPSMLSQPLSQERAASLYASLVPFRLIYLSNADINLLPRKHRQVYVLVDGRRSVEKIAAVLSISPQIVEEVLRSLQTEGTIAWR